MVQKRWRLCIAYARKLRKGSWVLEKFWAGELKVGHKSEKRYI